MLTLIAVNRLETQQLTHPSGPLEVGRGPARSGVPRLVLPDGFVSRDHLRVEELPGKQVRVENVSARASVAVDNHSLLTPGTHAAYKLPVRVGLGETVIDLDYAAPDPATNPNMRTVAPHRPDTMHSLPSLLALDAGVPLVDLVSWLETVLTVQRASDTTEFYSLTAKALVDQIGVDAGVVLLTNGTTWRVVAKEVRDERAVGRAFSHTLLEKVYREKRTFYLPAAAVGHGESMVGVHSVVASPILDPAGEVVGVVYGTRLVRAKVKEIGPVEAQVVQLLASAVGAGLGRAAHDAEAARLRVAKEAAEQADRAKGQFLAMVSHELRTPLTTILGYAEMLQEQAAQDSRPEYADDLGQIHAAAGHLLALINDILDFSKIEAGKMILAHEPFDPAGLVRDLAGAAEPLARTNRNRLIVDCPPTLGSATGDATRLRQCVWNLVGNACKFTQVGDVTVTARRAGASLTIQVRDTGCGMTADQVGRLFQPFTQVDSSSGRKHGGTGLGLAITRKLVEAMGGGIDVTSDAGAGSTFTLTVPADLAATGA